MFPNKVKGCRGCTRKVEVYSLQQQQYIPPGSYLLLFIFHGRQNTAAAVVQSSSTGRMYEGDTKHKWHTYILVHLVGLFRNEIIKIIKQAEKYLYCCWKLTSAFSVSPTLRLFVGAAAALPVLRRALFFCYSRAFIASRWPEVATRPCMVSVYSSTSNMISYVPEPIYLPAAAIDLGMLRWHEKHHKNSKKSCSSKSLK